MPEITFILDPVTGHATVEGLTTEEAAPLLAPLLGQSQEVNCARPLNAPLMMPGMAPASDGQTARLARVYHGSVVDGPGRRSVIQLQGCPIRCKGCYVPWTHDMDGGVAVGVDDIVTMALADEGAPRDGITVCGGEPFAQAEALAAIVRRLKAAGMHVLCYTGYTLEVLMRRAVWEPAVGEALSMVDVLIDGPYVQARTAGAGEWRGSNNQRLMDRAELDARMERVAA